MDTYNPTGMSEKPILRENPSIIKHSLLGISNFKFQFDALKTNNEILNEKSFVGTK